MSISRENDLEVARYPLTDLEQDALNHFPARASAELVRTLREAVMLFHNVGHQLYRQGLRIRIVPRGKRFQDLPEFANLPKEYDDSVRGLWDRSILTITVREETLLQSESCNRKYGTFMHEVAHAIWDMLLSPHERGCVAQFYAKERRASPDDRGEYRMKDVLEFFAESFVYFVTPSRPSRTLAIEEWVSFGRVRLRTTTKELTSASKQELGNLNPDMLQSLEGKFKNIIDPQLVMAKPVNELEEVRYVRWPGERLFLPVTHSESSKNENVQNW